jgi:hypothetical protein
MEASTMNAGQEQLSLPLECYETGELEIFTMKEALARLCRAEYGIVAPINMVTWCVEGHKGWNNAFRVAGVKPTILGLNIFMCHGQPFTIDMAEIFINNRVELLVGLFIAWAARFNSSYRKNQHGQSLPKELWPFSHVQVFSNINSHPIRPAYQMRDGRSSFVVAGVDRDQVTDAMVANWGFFWREFLRKWQS